MISKIFKDILVFPLINILVFSYHYIPDIGIVIILLTVLIRLVLLPSFHKSLKHQRALQKLQPKMDEIRNKYKDDKEAQAKAMMELYSVHKVNPLSSCLPLLFQLPILVALYQVFIQSLNGKALVGLYSFVPRPEHINPMFLHFLDLSKPNFILALIAALSQYVLGRMQLPASNSNSQDVMASTMRTQTLYMLPLVTLLLGIRIALHVGGKTFNIGLGLPAGLTLYWIVTTLFGLAQQYYILRKEANEALHAAK